MTSPREKSYQIGGEAVDRKDVPLVGQWYWLRVSANDMLRDFRDGVLEEYQIREVLETGHPWFRVALAHEAQLYVLSAASHLSRRTSERDFDWFSSLSGILWSVGKAQIISERGVS